MTTLSRTQKLNYSIRTIQKGLNHLATFGSTVILAPADAILNFLSQETYLDEMTAFQKQEKAEQEKLQKQQSRQKAQQILANLEQMQQDAEAKQISKIKSMAGKKGGRGRKATA